MQTTNQQSAAQKTADQIVEATKLNLFCLRWVVRFQPYSESKAIAVTRENFPAQFDDWLASGCDWTRVRDAYNALN